MLEAYLSVRIAARLTTRTRWMGEFFSTHQLAGSSLHKQFNPENPELGNAF